MQHLIPQPLRVLGLGAVATLMFLGGLNRPAQAEKSNDCRSVTTSLCQLVETCTGGFEPNGTCKYILTVERYYWRS